MSPNDKPLLNLRILMVLDAPYPRDIRVEKEVSALVEAGAKVSLVCYRRKGEPLKGEFKGCEIIRSKSEVSDTQKGWVDIYNSVFFRNPVLEKTLRNLPAKFDAVHVHDLPATLTVLRYARKAGIPAIYDMHENYPDAMKIWFSWRKNPIVRLKNKLFFRYKKWFAREAEMVRSFDRIITVVEEMKERIVRLHGVKEESVYVVSNTEPKDLFDRIGADGGEKPFGDRALVYVGSFGPHRGLDTVVEALPAIKRSVENIELIVVGTGNRDTISHLREIAERGGVEKLVKFKGQLPFEEAIKYMRGAFLNLIPHHSNGQNENGIPHKFFQILNSNFPLIVSSCRPMKRIIESDDAGLVFEAGDADSFAEKVIWADAHPEELIAKARRGKRLVQEKGYNWESDAQRLVQLYRSLELE